MLLPVVLFLLVLGGILVVILTQDIWMARRHRWLKQRFFPPQWNRILEQHWPLYPRLSEPLRQRLPLE